MAVTAVRDVPARRTPKSRVESLSEEDRAAVWLYRRLIGARRQPGLARRAELVRRLSR